MKRDALIVISGYGTVSALGSRPDDVWRRYQDDAIALTLKPFNRSVYPVGAIEAASERALQQQAASGKHVRRLDRSVLLAMLAAGQALQQSGWSGDQQTGVAIGSSRGATGLFESLHASYLHEDPPATPLMTSPLTTLGNISSEVAAFLGTSGMNICNSVTCSTALQSVGNAMAWLEAGYAGKFFAGAAEAPLTPFTLAQVEALGICTTDINHAYPARPFAAEEHVRNTFTLGEGAAVFAIEKIPKEQLSRKKPLVVIESLGYAFNSPPSVTGIDARGTILQRSMQMAIDRMTTKQPIDQVLLHGTGTILGDRAERNAIEAVFGAEKPNLYTNKWKVGHTYAASAALHLELAILMIRQNSTLCLPYENTLGHDPEKRVRKVMVNATGFGGNAMSLVVSSPEIT